MLETDPSQYFRSIIFPRKWKTNENNEIVGPPDTITCASAMAFGGFLDIRFRQHDFFLGRNNARNFLRYFFSFPYYKDNADPSKDDVHPIHRNWTNEMIETFKFEKKEGSGIFYLPIIPDLHLLSENAKERKEKRTHYDIPQKPVYDPEQLFKLERKIKKRFEKIFNVLQKRDFTEAIKQAKEAELAKLTDRQREAVEKLDAQAEKKDLVAEMWIEQKYGQSLFSKLGSCVTRPFVLLGIFFGKRMAAKAITRKIVSEILRDLASKKLLKKR